MFSIKNKVIIITGGGGSGMAHELALGWQKILQLYIV